MIKTLLFFSYLITHEWQWEAAAGAVKYRLYWHDRPDCYVATEYFEVWADGICGGAFCPAGYCCYEPGEPSGSKYLTITAVREDGWESPDPKRRSSCE